MGWGERHPLAPQPPVSPLLRYMHVGQGTDKRKDDGIVVCSGQTWREGGHVIAAAADPAVVSGCWHSPAAPTTRRRRRGRPSIDCVHRGHLDVSRRPTLCAATVHRVRVLN